jgi:superfamily II DNA or RNA helicase/HKD family nuclease
VIEQALAALPEKERVQAGVAMVDALIRSAVHERCSDLIEDAPLPSGEVLSAVCERRPDGSRAEPVRPLVPLLDTALMTHAPGEPRLLSQLISEIPSSDGIDLIMAFIRQSGIRPMLDALRRHTQDRGKSLRILTTTYTGSTEPAALAALQDLGAQVRVSYDTSTTRLHAKAWLFHRGQGLSTGYIGSSNLTHSAQVTGLEWNLRVSAARNRSVLERMQALFDSCWNGGDFVDFDVANFQRAVQSQRTGGRTVVLLPGIELRLEPFQERLLELIAIERQRGHHRNLLVSATGTGKTVMAAVDYARLRRKLPRSRLLFVAHRKEILEQSRATFCYALGDPAFGEFWVDGHRPERFEHVFASIQSLAGIDLADLTRNHFDVVIIDEVHHASATTYTSLLNHLEPLELIGLTATPERTDGESIKAWFGHRIAAELRLWDAIDQQRLVPFAYYGIPDNTDLRRVPWTRGRGYDALALTRIYTADHAWARQVLLALQNRVSDLRSMRALGFCVTVGHARFMAEYFSQHGLQAVAVSSETINPEREAALRRLAGGEINVVFSVDLFNEGVDVPAVDTLLMLRPTESPTLFLQQLGRGLRRYHDKTLCTVLDFVGHHHREFRYDARLGALLGGTRKQLIEQVEEGFPFLPSGCHMVLEGDAQARVLQSLRQAIPRGVNAMAEVVRQMRSACIPVSLGAFLEHSGLELEDVYEDRGAGRCWSSVLLAADESLAASGPHDAALQKACARLLHIDDAPRLKAYRAWLTQPHTPALEGLSLSDNRWLRMLMAGLSTSSPEIAAQSLAQALATLWQHPRVLSELRELFGVLLERTGHLGHPLRDRPDVPLQVHARYSRVEIQAAFGDVLSSVTQTALDDGMRSVTPTTTAEATAITACLPGSNERARVEPPPWREGVKWLASERCDVFLITLNKTEKRFSPTTRYRDYAISRDLLHWESQSGTTASSTTGQRYQQHARQGSAVMIFARMNADDRAFHFLGPATYLQHQGERPMQVTWRLGYSLPGDLLLAYRAAAA